ncbi:peptidase U62 [Sulfolobus sp. S-194]|uniref:metallopeptidase TldD-related protein n=1 Tax=Sulfolobus sp. S-194 TaxID=2512240 RepID=UPI001436F97F|nr:metallopeptidase TldD-related protein [Sulfolobus sp. S-194]QIW24577.1 peptidase U62 [Sulfolobus sp. S-194]
MVQIFFNSKEDSLIITRSGKYSQNSQVKAEMALTPEGWILENKEISFQPSKNFTPCISYEEKEDVYHEVINKAEKLIPYIDKIVIKRIERRVGECKEIKFIALVEKDYLKVGGKVQYIDSLVSYLQNEIKSVKRILRDYQTGGRVRVILSPEVFGTIIAYTIKILLNGNYPRLKLYEKVFPLTVFDNPLNDISPAFTVFDDEGVLTRKKELIGDGVVQDYLGTLYSRFGNPGNARGIPPEPDFFTLEIKGGDWSLEEMRDENKDAITIYGVESVQIIENSIRITPKIVEKDGIGLRIREIAVPFQDLLSIEALSKNVKPFALDEQHGIVSPYVLMPVRIILF